MNLLADSVAIHKKLNESENIIPYMTCKLLCNFPMLILIDVQTFYLQFTITMIFKCKKIMRASSVDPLSVHLMTTRIFICFFLNVLENMMREVYFTALATGETADEPNLILRRTSS